MAIYVETLVRAPLEAVWSHTQDPSLHEQWDVRFSTIDYVPRPPDGAAQRFRYTTRLGFGLSVSGEGETVGQRRLGDGGRASALRFWSGNRLSLIEEGSGFWKYEAQAGGVRFYTRYDYSTRFGGFGRVVDRLLFRPLMGWATAWSFDRLRIWLENGVGPEASGRSALVHGVARVALAAIFAYQAIVPKLLGPAADEMAMVGGAGIPVEHVPHVVALIGAGELVLAASLLLLWHRAWPALACLALTLLATLGVAVTSPAFLATGLNVVSLNLGVVALAVIDVLSLRDCPSAGRCLRQPPSNR